MRVMLAALLCGLAACAGEPEAQPDPAAPLGGKRVAITYDDAPTGDGPAYTGPERAAALIRGLAEAGAPAAFFVTTRGMNTEEGRARVAAYAEAGHLIANHSDTHPWLTSTPLGDYLADLDAAEAKLAGLPNRRPWFRFPFLDEEREDRTKRDAMRAALAERGLRNGYVTIDTYDWHLQRLWDRAAKAGRPVDAEALSAVYAAMVVEAAAFYDGMAVERLGRRPVHVLLLHENDLAARHAGPMIAALRAEGWTIVSPDEAYDDPLARQNPDTLFAGKGRLAALVYDRGGRGGQVFDHWSSDEAGIEARAEAAGVFGPPPGE